MSLSNYEQLLKLADEVFAVKSDPSQLDINPKVRQKLLQIHPATMSEYIDGDGPVAWLLVIPTTFELMSRFLTKEISEKELFELTPLNAQYDAIYLCSALVLEEYRRKGIVRNLACSAIENIRKTHPLKAAFVWAFSPEGDQTAKNIAQFVGLPLYKKVK